MRSTVSFARSAVTSSSFSEVKSALTLYDGRRTKWHTLAAAWLGGGDLNGRGHVDIELVKEGEWIARPRRGINDKFEGLKEDASRIMVGEIRPRIVVG